MSISSSSTDESKKRSRGRDNPDDGEEPEKKKIRLVDDALVEAANLAQTDSHGSMTDDVVNSNYEGCAEQGLQAIATYHIQKMREAEKRYDSKDCDEQTKDLVSMLRGIPGGGAFTNKRDCKGKLSSTLSQPELDELNKRIHLFNDWASTLQKSTEGYQEKEIILYRSINVESILEPKEGDVITDLVPSSCAWNNDANPEWRNSEHNAKFVVMQIQTTSKYRFVALSYPNGHHEGLPTPFNQEQHEVVIVPSKLTIMKVSGSTVTVTPQPLTSEEIDSEFYSAEDNIPKKKRTMDLDSIAACCDKFKKFPEKPAKDIVYTAKDGQRWELKIIDEVFGYTFEEAD